MAKIGYSEDLIRNAKHWQDGVSNPEMLFNTCKALLWQLDEARRACVNLALTVCDLKEGKE